MALKMRVNVARNILLFTSLLETMTHIECGKQSYSCPDGSRFDMTQPYSEADVMSTFKNRCKCSCCLPEEHLGCSSPVGFLLDWSYMEPACYIHDYCYDNPSRTKEECDNEFYYNMEMCLYVEENAGNWGIQCRIVRDSAYAAVRDLGDTHHRDCPMDCPCTRLG